MKTIELCGTCAAKMSDRYRLVKMPRPVDHKVYCEICRRMRYGAAYRVEKKERVK